MGHHDSSAISNYQPFVSIYETYETSDQLKCIKEILEFPEDQHEPIAFRNIITEFAETKWVKCRTNEIEYPQEADSNQVHSNLLDKDTDKLYVYDFHYFDTI